MHICSGHSLESESGTAERSIDCRRVTATAKTPWIASWALQRTPSRTVRPGIHRSGDSTSLNDGWMNTVSLQVALAEGRATMTHSETCRKRFEEIEKKKLDKRLEEEAARIPEPPPEAAAEMDVEQHQEQPMTGGASSSSGPAASVQEAAPVASPSSHDVRMEVTESSGSTRPLEGDDGESSNKRARSLAGMLLLMKTTRQTGRIQSGRRS